MPDRPDADIADAHGRAGWEVRFDWGPEALRHVARGAAAAPNETFSSWPSSALVDGVKTGSGSWVDSNIPSGRAAPCIVPDRRYSFHAEPVM